MYPSLMLQRIDKIVYVTCIQEKGKFQKYMFFVDRLQQITHKVLVDMTLADLVGTKGVMVPLALKNICSE